MDAAGAGPEAPAADEDSRNGTGRAGEGGRNESEQGQGVSTADGGGGAGEGNQAGDGDPGNDAPSDSGDESGQAGIAAAGGSGDTGAGGDAGQEADQDTGAIGGTMSSDSTAPASSPDSGSPTSAIPADGAPFGLERDGWHVLPWSAWGLFGLEGYYEPSAVVTDTFQFTGVPCFLADGPGIEDTEGIVLQPHLRIELPIADYNRVAFMPAGAEGYWGFNVSGEVPPGALLELAGDSSRSRTTMEFAGSGNVLIPFPEHEVHNFYLYVEGSGPIAFCIEELVVFCDAGSDLCQGSIDELYRYVERLEE